MEKKYVKCAIKPFFQLNPIAPISELLNEILFILVAQETAQLQDVKVGGLKIFCIRHMQPGFESQIFFCIVPHLKALNKDQLDSAKKE